MSRIINDTLSYSKESGGWVSFYSYHPEFMIGMNNFFYSFKGGNLYAHNTGPARNTFYQHWWTMQMTPNEAIKNTTLRSVFNDAPMESKLFKSIELVSSDAWDISFSTALELGRIDASWFVKKEEDFFSYIRNLPVPNNRAVRSSQGLGVPVTVSVVSPLVTLTYPLTFDISKVNVNNIIYGDVLGAGVSLGKVTQIFIDIKNGQNTLVIDRTGFTIPVIYTGVYTYCVKDAIAESNGVTGRSCIFDLRDISPTTPKRLFAINSEISKSFP